MTSFKLSILLLTTTSLLGSVLHARIGEKSDTLDRRLTTNRRGVEFENGENLWRGAPNPLRPLVSAIERVEDEFRLDHRVVFYYKKSVDDNIDKDERDGLQGISGWLLQVIYVNGQSVAEAYVRVADGMTQSERNGLLILQGAGVSWVDEKNLTEELRAAMQLEEYEQLMKHNLSTEERILQKLEQGGEGSDRNFYRIDGKIASVQFGNTMVFYDMGFHNKLAAADKAFKSDSVSESLIGF